MSHFSALPDIAFDASWKTKGRTVVPDLQYGSGISALRFPQGIALPNDQSLLIADSLNHRVISYDIDSGKIRRLAGQNVGGYRSDLLNSPAYVLFHQPTKSYIISDLHNRRIVQGYPNDRQCFTILLKGIACIGLATDIDGNLYVSDLERHVVRRYQVGAKHGIIVAGGHGQGRRLKQLNHPTYICVGNDSSVYVSDSGNHRVVQWRRDATAGIVVAGGQGQGKHRTQLDCPAGVMIDQLGTVYVVDSWNHRVMRWRKNEQPDVIAGDMFHSGDSAERLNYPACLTFDDRGNLYVSDSNNHRIQRFDIHES